MTRLSIFIAVGFLLAPLSAYADAYSFSTDPQSIAVGSISGAIIVSSAAPAGQTTCLLLSSDSSTGEFSSSADTWKPVSVVTMNSGSSNRTFYYQDASAGTVTLTVRVAPRPSDVSDSCAAWGDAAGAVVATLHQTLTVGSSPNEPASSQSVQSQSSVTDPQSAASAQTTAQSSGGAAIPAITARITTDATAVVGAGTLFSGSAFGSQGEPLSGARYVWNFGDGAMAEGAQVRHTYSYPGTYDVLLSVGYNYSSATARAALAAAEAPVALIAEGDGSLTVANQSDYDLDIGSWSLAQGTSTFMVPEGTMLLRGKGVRFAPAVLGFMGDEHATLRYANGAIAASASVGAQSPLRGEVVALADAAASVPEKPAAASAAPTAAPSAAKAAPASKAPAPTTQTEQGTEQAAAAGLASFGIGWTYLAGLAALIAIGAVGTYYAHPTAAKREEDAETFGEADEFEIEG